MSTQAQRLSVYGALTAAAVLLLTAPTPTASSRTLARAGSAQVVTDPLVALLALLAWCCAAYLLAVAALTAGARLPGAPGRGLAALCRRAAPAGLRRALEVALGVGLVVGTLGAGTASAAGPPGTDGGLVAHTVLQAPEQPAPVVAPSLDHPVSAPLPPLDHPVSAPSPSLDHPVTSSAPATALPAEPAAEPPVEPPVEPVVVRPGDSLWSIAQDRLGPDATDAQVAQAWPSWWQANREAVGDDPDLLHPGTPLVPPTDS